jgi:threonine dehydrogenase-like Zn-dependent dehydrogenase
MTVDEVEAPRPAPGEVVVRTAAAGICGSDVTSYLGRMGVSRPGQIRGHEFAGTVVDTVSADTDWLDLPVAVNPLVSCGRCRACGRGADNLCEDQVSLGIQLPGGFADLALVPTRNLVALVPGVDPRAAAAIEPLAQAVHDVRLALRDRALDTALVIGAGSIGLLVVRAAHLLGVGHVAALDPDRTRHAAARAAGADLVFADREAAAVHAVDPGADRVRGVDAVFDVVGTGGTRWDAVDWTARGGTAVFVGLHEDTTPLPWRDLLRREVTVRGSNASTRDDFRLATDWLSNGLAGLPVDQTEPMDRAPEVFAALATGQRAGSKVLFVPT